MYIGRINLAKSKILCIKCNIAINKEYESPNNILQFIKKPNFNLSNCYESTSLKRLLYDLTDLNIYLTKNKNNVNLIGDKVFEIFSNNILNPEEGTLVTEFLLDSLIEVKKEIILPSDSDNTEVKGDSISNYTLKEDYLAQMLNKESQENKFLSEFVSIPDNLISFKKILGNKKEFIISISKSNEVTEADTLFTNSTEMLFYFKLVSENRYILQKQRYKYAKTINNSEDGKL